MLEVAAEVVLCWQRVRRCSATGRCCRPPVQGQGGRFRRYFHRAARGAARARWRDFTAKKTSSAATPRLWSRTRLAAAPIVRTLEPVDSAVTPAMTSSTSRRRGGGGYGGRHTSPGREVMRLAASAEGQPVCVPEHRRRRRNDRRDAVHVDRVVDGCMAVLAIAKLARTATVRTTSWSRELWTAVSIPPARLGTIPAMAVVTSHPRTRVVDCMRSSRSPSSSRRGRSHHFASG